MKREKMVLRDMLNLLAYHGNEIDLKVCYSNEFDEECTFCRTYVPGDKYKAEKKYWGTVEKYDYSFPVEKLERYGNYEVEMLLAQGKDHIFIFACDFENNGKGILNEGNEQ